MNESVYILVLCFFALAVYRVLSAERRQKAEVHADEQGTQVVSRPSGSHTV
jgi:hypothetical protein